MRKQKSPLLKCGLHRERQKVPRSAVEKSGTSRFPAGCPGEPRLLCSDAVVSPACSLPMVMCKKCSSWSSVPGTASYLLISPTRSAKGNLLFQFRCLTVVSDLNHFLGAPLSLSSPEWQLLHGWNYQPHSLQETLR